MLPYALTFPLFMCQILTAQAWLGVFVRERGGKGNETHSQLRLPSILMPPYASILSLTTMSPLKVMLLPDLTEP